MSELNPIPQLKKDDRRLAAAEDLAHQIHELQNMDPEEPLEIQHSLLLMASVHLAMTGMNNHLGGIHRTTFSTFFGILMDYMVENAVMEFTCDAEDIIDLGIEILQDNKRRLRNCVKSVEDDREIDDEDD